MRSAKHWLWVPFLVLLSVLVAQAEQTFVFDRIDVQGASRIDVATIRHYLPIEQGESVGAKALSNAVRALYQTGFFQQVDLYQDGTTLVVRVEENPFVYQIDFEGNKALSTDEMEKVASQLGIKEGEPYHPDKAHTFKRAVIQEYQRRGFYNVAVVVDEDIKAQGRAILHIQVEEGDEAVVDRIAFSGNKAFSSATLLKQVTMRPRLWSFLSHNNRFSNQRLDDDLEAIRTLYLNHGYLQVHIDRPTVDVTKGSNLALNFVLHEGEVYRFGKLHLHYKGALREQLLAVLARLQPGDIFSRRTVQNVLKDMQRCLVDAGYANAQIKVDPLQNPQQNRVDLTFDVFAGKPVFVHEISFKGNIKTHERVLRREMRQFENSLLNQFQVEESERRLNNLGYFRHAKCTPRPVGIRDDLVDLHCAVEEISSATATASIGFSTQGGMLFGGSVSQGNFLGTGNSVRLKAERSRTTDLLQFSYTNPYFWSSEVSQTVSMAYQHTSLGNQNVTKYKTDGYHLGLDYSWPIGAYDYLLMGAKWSRLHVLNYRSSAQKIQDYIAQHGDNYWLYTIHLGWRHNHLNRAIFPTRGTRHILDANVALPISEQSLGYYTLEYRGSAYIPIRDSDYILHVSGSAGYGQGYGDEGHDLPFFKYYYAGGINSVRGYRANSLGPKDESNNAIGGNARLTMSAEILFPQWLGDQYRFGAFIDGGNVFDGGFEVGTSDSSMRYAAGLSGYIRTALVPIELALSVPLNANEHDEEEAFSFSLGMGF